MRAQYHASTRNGNLWSTLLKKRCLNTAVLGVSIVFVYPRKRSSLCLQGCSCEGRREGDNDLFLDDNGFMPGTSYMLSSISLSLGLAFSLCPLAFLPEKLWSVALLIHAPPNNKVTTTSGSSTAPIPMLYATVVHSDYIRKTTAVEIEHSASKACNFTAAKGSKQDRSVM